jgi:hypothetical protein
MANGKWQNLLPSQKLSSFSASKTDNVELFNLILCAAISQMTLKMQSHLASKAFQFCQKKYSI